MMKRCDALKAVALGMACCWDCLVTAAPSPIDVSGWPFELGELRDGEQAFLNRTYVWEHVPAPISGWKFTRLNGGLPARIWVTAKADGELFVATARGSLLLPGWLLVPEWRFNYTDTNRTILHVFRRDCRSGQRIEIPQGNWTGGIVLAPEVTGAATPPVIDTSRVPGVVIDHIPARAKNYIGCPSIAILSDGSYVASHSFFGPGPLNGRTRVFVSTDRGSTWRQVAEMEQHFSNLFFHRGRLYSMGVGRGGSVVIRRSSDGGETWSTPNDEKSGLLLPGPGYHCAPVPLVEHDGRVWRAMEDTRAGGGWPRHFRAFVMSAPASADLLDASNWRSTNRVPRTDDWPDREFNGWLEGNVVLAPDDSILNILRVDSFVGGKAAVIHISKDGRRAAFDPQTDFIDLPGGAKKFTIRFDPASQLYWSLTNVIDEHTRFGRTAGMVRNNLALIASRDLRHWQVHEIVLSHPNPVYHGFQYVDWQFDGADVVAVSRTAFDDGLGGAHNHHDANFFTFHRIERFRERHGE